MGFNPTAIGATAGGFGALLGNSISGASGSGSGGGTGLAPNPNVQAGVYDQKYIDYLKTLDRKSLAGDKSGLSTDLATLNNFQSVFGRDPTATEFGMFAPYGTNSGQIISQLKYQQDNSPENLYKKQQAQYQQDAPNHYDTVTQQFQSLLGRAPTQDELSHYGAQLASGTTDPYELGQFLQQTPEYANAADAKFRTQLGGQLNDVNSQFFSQYIQPSVMGQFASQGRDISGASTSLQFALANSAKEMQTQTQQYLAGLGAQQYAGREGQATSDYQTKLAQNYGFENAGVGNTMSQNNSLFGNTLNNINSDRQFQQLMQYLNANKPSNGEGRQIGSMIGGGLGVAGGAYFGGPAGASAGYAAGSGIGGGFGGLFG